MENIEIQGQCIIGICKGISQRSMTNRKTGEIMTFTELGIAVDTVDNFGYAQEHTITVSLTKGQISDGAVAKLQALKDKRVAFPVWYRAFTKKDGADISIYLTNDWDKTHALLGNAPLKAAS